MYNLEIELTTTSEDLIPKYESKHASGVDLKSRIDFILQPGESYVIPTGLKMSIPDGFEMQVRPKSGLAAKKGITVLNSPGTVDCLPYNANILVAEGEEKMLEQIVREHITHVLSYNESKEIIEEKAILEIFDKGSKEMYEILLEDDSKIFVTENELLYTLNGLKFAKSISIGDKLISCK